MAKTIKFNLNCDGHPVRTLEDLREHFSMEDVLEYLNNGMLARWLDIRGYAAEKEQVEQITAQNMETAWNVARQGGYEDDARADTEALHAALDAAAVPCHVEIWGSDVSHDWYWWGKEFGMFAARIFG